MAQAHDRRTGIYLPAWLLRTGFATMGAAVLAAVVLQWPAIRRYAKMETM